MYYDFIKSKTLREYYDKNNIELSDFEKVVLWFNGASKDIYNDNPESFIETLTDQTIKKDVIDYVDDLKKPINDIKNTSDDSICILTIYYDDDTKKYVLPFELGYKKGIESGCDFNISKHKIISEQDANNTVINTDYNSLICELNHRDNNDDYYYPYQSDNEINEKVWRYYICKIKHPFRYGDCVYNKDTNEIGVVNDMYFEDDKTEKEYWNTHFPKNSDWTYLMISCEWLQIETGDLYFDYCFPWNLEKISTNKLPKYLKEIVDRMVLCRKNDMSLCYTEEIVDEYKEWINEIGSENLSNIVEVE